MKKKIQIVESGIKLVDKAWGGFYRGGTYLLVGPRKSGRTLLSLQFALECAREKEVCLFFTNMRPKDLMIHAASIDFDIQQYMNQNLIIVVRVAPPLDIPMNGDSDEYLTEYLNDIVTVVDQYRPTKIIFDELTPFVGFNNIPLLQQVFLNTIEGIEELGITSLFVLGDPATQLAKTIVDSLASNSTGVIYLQKKEDEEETHFAEGKIIITPNIGHTEGQVKANYKIEPYKGVVDDYNIKPAYNSAAFQPKKDLKYKSLADIDLPVENNSFSNYYNVNDFKLILNNQIALYKSTGQSFSIISFKLDEAAEKHGLLTVNQLKSAVRLAIDKKEKICVLKNKVVVLVIKDDPKVINSLIARIKANLPNNDKEYLQHIIPYISVFVAAVNDEIMNADDLFKLILADETEEQDNLKFN